MGSIEVMSVDAVPVVKVEHLKELLPAQRSPRRRGPLCREQLFQMFDLDDRNRVD